MYGLICRYVTAGSAARPLNLLIASKLSERNAVSLTASGTANALAYKSVPKIWPWRKPSLRQDARQKPRLKSFAAAGSRPLTCELATKAYFVVLDTPAAGTFSLRAPSLRFGAVSMGALALAYRMSSICGRNLFMREKHPVARRGSWLPPRNLHRDQGVQNLIALALHTPIVICGECIEAFE